MKMPALGPIARIAAIALAGAIVLSVLGRWDGRINERERAHEERYQAEMARAAVFRVMLDSVNAVTDSLAKVDAALALQEKQTSELLRELDALAQAEVDSLASSPVQDLLPSLRMRPIQRADGGTGYVTDEDGVRFLAGRMLRLDQVERQLPAVQHLADTRLSRINVLIAQKDTIQTALDSALSRVDTLEPLLEESNQLRRQKGKWFGWIPKPPPELTFLAGVTLGIVLTR